jgi:hypothetical protein
MQISLDQLLQLLGTVAVVVTGIKALQFLFSLTPTGKLKLQVEANTKHLAEDFERFKTIDKKITDIEFKLETADKQRAEESQKLNASLNMIGTSVASILNHMIDGNGVDEMKEERDRLTSHFINRQ